MFRLLADNKFSREAMAIVAVSGGKRIYRHVGDACGLPGPVIARLVPRTWTDSGWMQTAGQLQYAVDISADVLNGNCRPHQ
jgi:hypothetical protein